MASAPPDIATTIPAGPRLRVRSLGAFGVAIEGFDDPAPHPDWLHELLAVPAWREALFALVDREGLVVCRDVHAPDPEQQGYRGVRGRSSRGRLSQGEYYHHDGCSTPTRPRIVEIRFPHQATPRHTRTAIAPFPDTVVAMLDAMPSRLSTRDDLAPWRARITARELDSATAWDQAQGVFTRLVRRELSTPDCRAYFDAVDVAVGAYRAAWEPGESRLIANENPIRTMQHRRAYLEAPDGRPNGHLVKRWPNEELAP